MYENWKYFDFILHNFVCDFIAVPIDLSLIIKLPPPFPWLADIF